MFKEYHNRLALSLSLWAEIDMGIEGNRLKATRIQKIADRREIEHRKKIGMSLLKP